MIRFILGLLLVIGLAACGFDTVRVTNQAHSAFVEVISVDVTGSIVSGGSGSFIDRNGTVLTAAHVVSGEGKFMTIPRQYFVVTNDGIKHEAEVIFTDKNRDFALVRLKDGRVPTGCLRLSQKYPTVGEQILIVGTPLLIGETNSSGTVGAIRESPLWKDAPAGFVWIQISVFVVHGYSGGPVLNDAGTIIGIVSHGPVSQVGTFYGIGYATPSKDIYETYRLVLGVPPIC